MKKGGLFKRRKQKITLLENDGSEWCKAKLQCEANAKDNVIWLVVVPNYPKFGEAAGLDWPLMIRELQRKDGHLSVKLPRELVVHGRTR